MKGVPPNGACYSENIVFLGQHLFCLSQQNRTEKYDLYSLELGLRQWQKVDIKLSVENSSLYKIDVKNREEIILLSRSQKKTMPFLLNLD